MTDFDESVKILHPDKENTLVLLHGFPYSNTMWDAIGSRIDRNWRIVLPNAPGFDSYRPSSETFEISDFAGDLKLVCEQYTGNGKVVLGGFSMGGYILLQALFEGTIRYDGLIFMNTRATADTEEGKLGRQKAIDRIHSGDLSGFVADFIPPTFAPDHRTGSYAPLSELLEQARGFDPSGVIGALHAMKNRQDRSDTLKQLDVPVLFITGSDDALTGESVMGSLPESVKKGSFETIQGAGHMTPVENPEAVANVVNRFLRDLIV